LIPYTGLPYTGLIAMSKETELQPPSANQGRMNTDHGDDNDANDLKNDVYIHSVTTSISTKKRNRGDSNGERNLKVAASNNLESTERCQSGKKFSSSTNTFRSTMKGRYKNECSYDENEVGSVASVDPNEKKDTRVLNPSPFFFYTNYSLEPDDDPLTPLTLMARVPNFPAKMHAILTREDLSDVIAWMSHGRSWRILNPRDFEIRVLPAYFDHSKFSSFIRQANGWGFRRITQGRDRNSYYNERFLRAMPHLCKKMHRPGVAKKKTINPDQEPDFYEISKMLPVPEEAPEDSGIALESTVRYGPRARIPVHPGISYAASKSSYGNCSGKETSPVCDRDKKIEAVACPATIPITNNNCAVLSITKQNHANGIPTCSQGSNMNNVSTLAMTAAAAIETAGRVKAVAEKQQILLGQSLQQQMRQRQLIIAAANRLREYENAAVLANHAFNPNPYTSSQIPFTTNIGGGTSNEHNIVSSAHLINCLCDSSLFSSSVGTATGDSQNVHNNPTSIIVSGNSHLQNDPAQSTELSVDRQDSAFRLAAATALTSDQLADALSQALSESRSKTYQASNTMDSSSHNYQAWS